MNNLTMVHANISEAIEIAAHGIKNKLNVLFMGPPGCGKSQGIAQAAKQLGYKYHEANPTVKDPIDFKGLFGISDGVAKVFPLPDIKLMQEATEPTVVNFDDISWAPLAVQAPVLQITQSRMIDGVPISDNISFVITSNRRKDGSGSTLLAPLINRFCVIDIKPDVQVWCKWAIKNGVPPIVVAFAQFREKEIIEAIETFAPSKDLQPFVSFRSLANLGSWYASGMKKFIVYRGLIGDALATEFVAFEKTYNDLKMFDTNKIIKDPRNSPIPDKQDVLYSVVTKLAFIADDTNFNNICIYANRLTPMFESSLITVATEKNENLKKSTGYINWLSRNSSMNNNII